MLNIFGSIAKIVEESLILINEKRRLSIKKELREITEEIYEYENLPHDQFDDDRLTRLYDKLFIFLQSYASEISKQNPKANP